MARFRVERRGAAAEALFDDGGMNLLSRAALVELDEAIAALERSGGLASLVFRSARERLFAAGADMAEMQRFGPFEAMEFARLGQELFARIERLPFLTICFIDGDCFGGALDLSMAFDLRIATNRSRFSHPGAKIGIVTGFGGTSRWKRIFGRPAAARMFLANEVLAATGALESGVIDGIADSPDSVKERAQSVDGHTTIFLKELSRVSPRLSNAERLLFARRLGHIYFSPH